MDIYNNILMETSKGGYDFIITFNNWIGLFKLEFNLINLLCYILLVNIIYLLIIIQFIRLNLITFSSFLSSPFG